MVSFLCSARARLSRDPSQLSRDPSQLSRDPSQLSRDPSQLSRDPSQLSRDPSQQMVELKSGDSYNGTLVAIDHLMNLHLKEVTWTSADGQKFWKVRPLLPPPPPPPPPPPHFHLQLNECFIRGNCIKYFRVPEDTVEKVKEESMKRPADEASVRPGGRGGRGGYAGAFSPPLVCV
jgi:small nuclear ribonucleoprotein (snRNP)-like protein